MQIALCLAASLLAQAAWQTVLVEEVIFLQHLVETGWKGPVAAPPSRFVSTSPACAEILRTAL